MGNRSSFRILLSIIVFSLLGTTSYIGNIYAQNAKQFATGTVVDEQGQPMPGVNVICQNVQGGATTAIDGTFRVQVKGTNPVLEISFIGFQKQEVTIKDFKKPIKVVLIEDSYMLDEFVKIGYGTQTKRTITSAITSIKSEDLSGYAGSSIEQTIAGLVPGVRIQTSDAAPGGDINVEVRGIGTATAGASPLFIVDGIPMEGGLSSVNPDDVANIQILKDAASTAIYGSRGANGVILITTKRGAESKPRITLSATTTIAQAQRKYELMNTAQLLEYYNDRGLDKKYRYTTNTSQEYFPFDENLNTDWQDAIFQNAIQQKYNLSISGGSKNMSYRLSGEYFDQEGILICTGMKRFSFRSNFDITLNKWAKVSVNFAPTFISQKKTREGGEGSNSVIRTAISMYPFFPITLPNGEYFSTLEYNQAPKDALAGRDPVTGAFPELTKSPLADNQDNPIRIAKEYKDQTSMNRLTGGINFDFTIAKGLVFKPSIAIDVTSSENSIWYPASIGKNRTDSEASTNMLRKIMWINENILTYQKEFGDHSISAVGGMTMQSNQFRRLYTTAYRFATESLPSINGGVINGGAYDKTEDRMLSYVARLSYDYKKKYMIQGVFRADGSSRFGANNRYGYFPSVSAGWAITEEKFMKPLKSVLSEMKVRGSYGLSGNNAIGDYNYETKMSQQSYIADNSITNGWAPSNIGNPNLKWEVSKQTNLGIDIGFLHNRIFMQLDLYKSTTSDMLLNTIVPSTLGVSRMLQNIGSVENKGVEFNIVSRNLTGKLKWTTTFNISANRNKVLALGLDSEAITDGVAESNITKVGYPLGMFYGCVFGGIYQSMEEIQALRNDPTSGLAFDPNVRPGDCKWYDLNGDGLFDDNDRTIIGNPYPRFNAGMVNTFSYKNFLFSFQLNGQYGNEIYNYTLRETLRGNYNSNLSIKVANRWRSPDSPGNGLADRAVTSNDVKPSTEVSKFTNRLLEDGSYLSIRNIRFSYTFDKKKLKKTSLQEVVLNLNIDNLHTFTNYTGLNPEANTFRSATAPGIDRTGYPVSRNFTVGLQVTL